jgi:phosphopantetheine--protein transferase-like protein
MGLPVWATPWPSVSIFHLPSVESAIASEDAMALLDSVEHAELEKIRAPQRRREWLYGRYITKHQLANLLNCSTSAIHFDRSQRGKPFVRGHSMPFNISHSGDYFGLAAGLGGDWGLDIEVLAPRRELDYLALAERFFHPDEFALVTATSAQELKRVFFKLWTLKEALLKAKGTGIAGEITQLNVCPFLLQNELPQKELSQKKLSQNDFPQNTWSHDWATPGVAFEHRELHCATLELPPLCLSLAFLSSDS